jgi:hypothetical protein
MIKYDPEKDQFLDMNLGVLDTSRMDISAEPIHEEENGNFVIWG